MRKPIDYNFSLIPGSILDEITKLYSLTNCIYVPFLGVGEEIFSANVLSDTSPKSLIVSDQGTFFVKQIPWYAKNEKIVQNRINFLHEIQLHDIPSPDLILTKNNKKFVKIKGDFYYLTTLLQNQGPKKDKSIALSIGENIAKIHLFSSVYSVKKAANHHSENIIETCLKLSELLNPEEHKFVKDYTKNIDLPYYTEIKILVHGDLNPSNIIFSKNSVLGFVDFDNVVLDNPVRDFVESIVTFCAVDYFENTSNIEKFSDHLNEDLAIQIIEGYKKNAPHIFIKFKHLIIPATKIILLEIFLISKLRGFIPKDYVFKERKDIINQMSSVLLRTETTQGVHIIDTFEGVINKKTLLDGKKVIGQIVNKVKEAGLGVLKSDYFNFNPGYTLYVALEESHITLHSWPKEDKLHLDIFVCNYSTDNTEKAHKIYDYLRSMFKPSSCNKQIILRK